MKTQLGPSGILFPVPASLVVSGSFEEPNIITVAWIGMMSASPPTLTISLKKNRYSLELIRNTKEFTVNIPQSDKFKEVDYCGIVSGRERNKFHDTSFTPQKSKKIASPIIKECPFNIECKAIKEVDVGGWVMILGEVVEVHVDQDKVTVADKNRIDIGKVDPLVYCATVREYWKLDSKLGDGFQAGREIEKKVKDSKPGFNWPGDFVIPS